MLEHLVWLEILLHSEDGWSLVLKSCSMRQLAQQKKVLSIPCNHHEYKSPRSSRTFEEYATLDVLSTIQVGLHSAKHNRRDIVFNLSEDVSETKGVKQVQNSIQLVHFSQKQWEYMIIDIKRRFHQQPHDRPRWFCPLYSREGGHTNYATKGGGPEGVLMAKASNTDIICIAVSHYDVSFPKDWSTPAVNCM